MKYDDSEETIKASVSGDRDFFGAMPVSVEETPMLALLRKVYKRVRGHCQLIDVEHRGDDRHKALIELANKIEWAICINGQGVQGGPTAGSKMTGMRGYLSGRCKETPFSDDAMLSFAEQLKKPADGVVLVSPIVRDKLGKDRVSIGGYRVLASRHMSGFLDWHPHLSLFIDLSEFNLDFLQKWREVKCGRQVGDAPHLPNIDNFVAWCELELVRHHDAGTSGMMIMDMPEAN